MGDLREIIMKELKSCPNEISEIVMRVIENGEGEIIEHMRMVSVVHGSDALLEAELPDNKIIALLQKHYDLRRSEAEKVLQQAKNRAAKKTTPTNGRSEAKELPLIVVLLVKTRRNDYETKFN